MTSFFAGDFDGDGRTISMSSNGNNWSYRYLGMLKSSGSALSDIKAFHEQSPQLVDDGARPFLRW